MSNQTYLQLVAEIRHVCSSLSLQLPTHSGAIATQLRVIHGVRQRLEELEVRVRALASRSWRPARRDEYQTLNYLLCNLLTQAINMALLAEEFLADPEGSMSCLRLVNQRKDQLMDQLHELERLCRSGRSLSNIKVKIAKSFPTKPVRKRSSTPQKRSLSN